MKTTTAKKPRFGANVIADVERRNRPAALQKKTSPYEFLDGLTATEKNTLLRIHTDVTSHLINIKQSAFHIGELLCQAKKILPHGKFQPWIETFFRNDLPYSTAYFYMRIYEVIPEPLVKKIPTQYMLMLTQKNFPAKILDQIKAHPDKFNSTSLKEVRRAYNLFKKGRIGSNQFLQLAKEQIQVEIDIAHKSTRHRTNSISRMSLELGAGDLLKRIRDLRLLAHQMGGLYPHDPKSKAHKGLIEDIDKTIRELEALKVDLEGRSGFWRIVSTEDGDKVISNY